MLADSLQTFNQNTDEATPHDRLAAFRRTIESGPVSTLVPLLPLLFNLKGKPYTLEDFFPFEAIFATQLPRQMTVIAGRQVAKSQSMAARNTLLCNLIPNFGVLFVTPLYEQIRRFSTQYVRPLIDLSPVKSLWTGTTTENSVLQKSFKNHSKMYFSFALLDAERTRGISCDALAIDEIQNMDRDLIPIMRETMAASKYRLLMYTGTPKTLDNTAEGVWTKSSMAEWAIACLHCKYLNIPAAGLDIEKMIGPWHPDIGDFVGNKRPGVICAKCGQSINPRLGRWCHKYPEKMHSFPGYHVPQIIMPMHYADSDRWSELLGKQQGAGNMTTGRFYNEVLGVSYDTGTKLVSKTELQQAGSLTWENNPLHPSPDVVKRAKGYLFRVMGVDWGGGGEEEISFTTMAVLGVLPGGKIDILYGRRLLHPHEHVLEGTEIMHIFNLFGCKFMAHDYNGAGALRETFMVHAGLPEAQIIPLVYYRSAAKNIMVFHQGSQEHPRSYWHLDKARSLVLTCACLKMRWMRSFKYDWKNDENPGLMSDFLALVECKVETARGPDVYSIQRNPMFTDDFAHSVNFAACTIWHHNNSWPNIAELAKYSLSLQQVQDLNPAKPVW